MEKTLNKLIIIFFIVSPIIGFTWYKVTNFERKLKSWSIVNGKLSNISIVKKFIAKSPGSSGPAEEYWMLEVQYQYHVNGKAYRGNRFSNIPPQNLVKNTLNKPPSNLNAYLDRYKVGNTYQVHYNPKAPEKSFLEVDFSGSKIFNFLIFSVLSLGLIMIIIKFFIRLGK